MKIIYVLIGLISSTWSIFIQRSINDASTSQINLNELEFRQINTFKSATGKTKYKKQQQYKDIDIYGATMVIEESNNILTPILGRYFEPSNIKSDINDNVTPLISETEALQTAIQHYIPNGDATDLFGYEWGESVLTTTIDLNIYKNENDGINKFTLSYIIEFSYQDTETENVYRPFTVLNAKTGNILYTFAPMIDQGQEHAWGTGGNAKTGPERHGPMEIDASPDVKNTRVEVYAYPLIGSNNPTLGQCIYETPSICEIQDVEINTAPNALADAYMWANIVFNLYDDWGPRNENGQPIPPLAPNNLPLKFYVHYGTNYENAMYSGGAMYFGDGQNRFYPLVSLDVSAHEVAHGFTSQGSNLRYQDQSGGINEAYSDLAGETAEAYYRGPETVKWICGYDIDKAGCNYAECGLRYLYNPPLDGNSIDHVNDYFNGMNVHYSSGVYNKGWFNLATMALWEDWSIQNVFLLASQANYYYWGRDTNYDEGLCGLQAAVDDLFPENEQEARKQDIALAWQNQGVYCISNNGIKYNGIMPPAGDDGKGNGESYLIYGIVGAIVFLIGMVLLSVWVLKRRRKILNDELNGGGDAYGAIVSADERQ
eukprot:493048_1